MLGAFIFVLYHNCLHALNVLYSRTFVKGVKYIVPISLVSRP
jgi:hypothetical protein